MNAFDVINNKKQFSFRIRKNIDKFIKERVEKELYTRINDEKYKFSDSVYLEFEPKKYSVSWVPEWKDVEKNIDLLKTRLEKRLTKSYWDIIELNIKQSHAHISIQLKLEPLIKENDGILVKVRKFLFYS